MAHFHEDRGEGRAYRLRWSLAAACLVAAFAVAAAPRAVEQAPRRTALPERLGDAEFWALAVDVSEAGGYFRITDNYTSNEREVGSVFTHLRTTGVGGGVYLGVGPEQNFTYIAAIRPAMAFIIDIRRQAAMQHLMYKAIFELADDRADFLSLLFSKPRPRGIDRTTSIQAIWDAFWPVATDVAAGERNFDRIATHLTKTRAFTFTDHEASQLRSVFEAFMYYGPVISTRGAPAGRGGGSGATFADLTGYSYDMSGVPQSFLSTDEHYQTVRALHRKNLIVPVTGDFGGEKALRAIGAWLKARNAPVSAFYLSNVEQYLFQDGKARAFYDNVAALPLTGSSVFIRPHAARRLPLSATLCPIAPFLGAVQAGRVYSNNDALSCVR